MAPRTGHKVFAFNERLFAVGGQSSATAASLLIESAVVDQGGNLNAFSVTAALPAQLNAGVTNFGLAQSALSGRNRIYLAGGETAAVSPTPSTAVAIGLVNTDGSILWSVGPALPWALSGCQLAIVGTWLYCIGGDTLTSTVVATNVLASKIQSDGSLGPWIQATPFPGGGSQGGKITGHLAMGSKTWLYVGGGIPKGGSASQFIWRARADQGSGQNLYWDKEQLGMSSVRVNAGAPALLLGPLAIVGGSTTAVPAQALATSDELKLSGDGSIIQLLAEDALPRPIMGAQVCALNNQIFAVGGQNSGATYLSSVYQATLQSNVTF
jgi:hypothetical protein